MKTKILAVCLICFYLTSCATLFKGTNEEVSFNSEPQKAQVYVNGQLMGETPLSLKLETKKTYAIEFRKEGFKPKTYNITNKVEAGWIILDILGCLIPVVVDASTGAWYSLSTKNVNMVLEKQQPK